MGRVVGHHQESVRRSIFYRSDLGQMRQLRIILHEVIVISFGSEIRVILFLDEIGSIGDTV